MSDLLAAVPAGATAISIEIVGVSDALETQQANERLAVERAARLQRELESGGLTGDYRSTTDQSVISPAQSGAGKALTTVRITYRASLRPRAS